MQLAAREGGYPHIVVSDGRILEANLRHLGLDLTWLQKELERQGAADAADIYLMTVDEARNTFLARKEETT